MSLKRAVGLGGQIRRASARRGRYRFERPADAWRRRARALGVALVLGALAFRAILPSVISFSARRTLGTDGWAASIEDVDLQLWRARWTLHGVRMQAPDGAASFQAESIEISLSPPNIRLARPRSRLAIDRPRLQLSRPSAVADIVERVRELASDSIVEWRVQDGAVEWPLAGGAPLELVHVHGAGFAARTRQEERGAARLSASVGKSGRLGLEASAFEDGGLLLKAAGSRLPGRFAMAAEAGEAAHLLSGGIKGELEPEPLIMPHGGRRAEMTVAAFAQALEAAARRAR